MTPANLINKFQFFHESWVVYGISAKKRAGLNGRISKAIEGGNLIKAAEIINQYYALLATNQKYGRCKPLQIMKNICILQKTLAPETFSVSLEKKSNSIIYEGDFIDSVKRCWPLNRLLAYHSYLQALDTIGNPFCLHVGDCDNAEGPIWIGCSNRNNHTLIPDAEFLGSGGYQGLHHTLERRFLPFESRQDILYWRGGVNCRTEDAHPWKTNPRIKLCQHVRGIDLPIKTDVKVVGIDYIYKENYQQEQIRKEGIVGHSVRLKDFQNFKYHIDIDGYSNAWSGLFTKLMMGCVVFKVLSDGGYKQWYYEKLTPFEHYIPVASDLSDLRLKINWAVNNPVLCRKISIQARALSYSLTYEHKLL